MDHIISGKDILRLLREISWFIIKVIIALLTTVGLVYIAHAVVPDVVGYPDIVSVGFACILTLLLAVLFARLRR